MRLSSIPSAKFAWDDWQETWGLPSETVGVERFNQRYEVRLVDGKCIIWDCKPPFDEAPQLYQPKQLKLYYSCLFVVRSFTVDGHGFQATRKLPLLKVWMCHPLR